ncbi:MAG TPA: hypothetical protein VNG53_12055, partial [Bacteroidia bacterium]|nr:hypothetical protein [Bacteroidia bacterium]
MNAKKIFGLCVIGALATSLSIAQQADIPSKNIFFKGDSLNGFNTTLCYQEAVAKKLDAEETSTYFYIKEKDFIEHKYHLPIPVDNVFTGNYTVLTSACNNVDFENGDFGGWTGSIGYNANSNSPLSVTSPVIT